MPKENGNETIYIGFPFLTDIDKFVTNELTARGADRIRSITPFVRATPGFISNQNNHNDRIVLQGIQANLGQNSAAYKFNDLYRPGMSMRPPAGITSVNIDFKNKYGSIRKATISWICHSTEDLELLSQYFLNPGHTILLEWGWSKAATEVFDMSDNIDLATYLIKVRKKIKHSNGNYDAMLGIIINYNWSLNRDGGFECTTEILSSGILMEGITIPEQKTIEPTSDGTIQNVISTLKSVLTSAFYSRIQADYDLYKHSSNDHDYFIYAKDSNMLEVFNRYIKVDDTGNTKTTTAELPLAGATPSPLEENSNSNKLKEDIINSPVYLSWGYIQDAFINPNIRFNNYTGQQVLAFNDDGIKIGHHIALRSTDLGVCIIPERNTGGNFNTEYAKDVTGDGSKVASSIDNFYFDKAEFKSGKSEDGLKYGYVRRILINAEFFRQTMLNSVSLNDGILSVFSKINDACGSFWEFIIINREFSYEPEGQQEMMSAHTSTTVKKLNPVDAIYKYSIVDVNYADRVTELKPYIFRTRSFEAYGDRTTSVIKNINLQSKLSNASALNVFYTANRGDTIVHGLPNSTVYNSLYKAELSQEEKEYTANKRISAARNDAFSVSLAPANTSFGPTDTGPPKRDVYASGPYITPPPEDDEKNVPESEHAIAKDSGFNGSELLAEQSSYPVELKMYLPLASYKYNFPRKDSKGVLKGLTGKQGMKIAVLENSGTGETEKSVKSNSAIIPVTCEIESEGISGIRIGDIFLIDCLPKLYKDRGVFQCIGLTHSITKDTWVTKITGGYRINRKKGDLPSSSSYENTSITESYIEAPPTVTNIVSSPSKKLSKPKIKDNTKKAMNYFISKGFTVTQAAALVGGFIQESNLNPTILNSIGAFGIAQWLGNRRTQLFNKYPEMSSSSDDEKLFYKQLDYVMYEFKSGGESVAYNKLKQAVTFEDACIAAASYERFWCSDMGFNFQGEKYNPHSKPPGMQKSEWGLRAKYAKEIIDEKLYGN